MKTPVRVLLINDFFYGGGAEGVFRETYSLLKRRGTIVEYFCGEQSKIQPKSLFKYIYNQDVKNRLSEVLINFKPTVIHIHNYYHYLSLAVFSAIKEYCKINNAKVVFTAHDYHLICPSSGMMYFEKGIVRNIPVEKCKPSFWLFKKLDHRGFKYSLAKKIQWFFATFIFRIQNSIDVVVSPSDFLKSTFQKNYQNYPIIVIRNPINLKVPKDVTLHKDSTQNSLSILFIGRLSREKGLYEFLAAYGESDFVNETSTRIDILGKGEEEMRLKALVEASDLSNVYFHGFKDGGVLEDYLLNANVLLLPSVWYENAPLSIIEGAAYGNIILARKLGGMTEMSNLTSSKILVDDWNVEINNVFKKLKNLPPNTIFNEDQFSSDVYLKNILKIYSVL
ncbi:glycosyltransferase [Leeuwenhoekiella sp. W20_SRS_FM14]|uniref:glycosyltransferase n=1 Tax=Leeuwenhoekiella sp. W20_SRS_FM14 TaxID=3240270 RepID=UPI003F9B17A9